MRSKSTPTKTTFTALESQLEKDAVDLARLFGWIAFKGFSRPGGADQVFVRRGVAWCAEFKRYDGKQRMKQRNEEGIIKDNGTAYFVIRSFEEFKEALSEMSNYELRRKKP